MMKNIKLRKVFAIIALFAMALTIVPVSGIQAAPCALIVSAPSTKTVDEGGSVSFTFTFGGDIADISLRDSAIKLVGFTANKTFAGTGNVRTVTLSNIQGTGEGKYIKVAGGIAISSDGKGSNAVNSGIFTVNAKDTVAPTLTISDPSKATVKAGETVSYTLNFADNVAVVDLSVRNTGIKLEGFKADVSISGEGNAQRTVTLSNIQGEVGGNKYIRVAGGMALDAKGNGSNAANSKAFTIVSSDDVAPVLSIVGPNLGKIYAGETVSYVLNFTDNIAVVDLSVRESGIKLVGFTADIKITGEGNAQRTVTLSNVQGEVGGNKYIKVAGGMALDAKGNGSNAADSQSFEVIAKPVEQPTEPTKPVDPVDPPAPEKPADWKDNPNTGINI